MHRRTAIHHCTAVQITLFTLFGESHEHSAVDELGLEPQSQMNPFAASDRREVHSMSECE